MFDWIKKKKEEEPNPPMPELPETPPLPEMEEHELPEPPKIEDTPELESSKLEPVQPEPNEVMAEPTPQQQVEEKSFKEKIKDINKEIKKCNTAINRQRKKLEKVFEKQEAET